MENELIKKYIQISKIIITVIVFIVLNIWFLFENDPQWILALIISVVVFIINYPSSRICILIIKKGDKITGKILKVLYYLFVLPIIFSLVVIIIGLLCTLIISFFISISPLQWLPLYIFYTKPFIYKLLWQLISYITYIFHH